MKIPGYPSNREADESVLAYCHRKPLRKREGARVGRSKAGRLVYTVKNIPLGVGMLLG